MANTTDALRRQRDELDQELQRREALEAAEAERLAALTLSKRAQETVNTMQDQVNELAVQLTPATSAIAKRQALLDQVEKSEIEETAAALRPVLEERVQLMMAVADEALHRWKDQCHDMDQFFQGLQDQWRQRDAWLAKLVRRRRFVLLGVAAAIGVVLTLWRVGAESSRSARLAALEGAVAEQTETLRRIEEVTWGVVFHEREGERFLVLPAGGELLTGWDGGRAAVKLERD